jgi:hypothetical protein
LQRLYNSSEFFKVRNNQNICIIPIHAVPRRATAASSSESPLAAALEEGAGARLKDLAPCLRSPREKGVDDFDILIGAGTADNKLLAADLFI